MKDMIERVAEWLRDYLGGPEVWLHESSLGRNPLLPCVVIRRNDAGSFPPRGAYRVDGLDCFVYAETMREAEALYQRCAELVKGYGRPGMGYRRIYDDDAKKVVIAIGEEGSPASNVDDHSRWPHLWCAWFMTVSR